MLRLQLLWALTLGANIQAFVIWQTFRVPVDKYSRGRAWTAREEWRDGLSRERIGGRARLLSMRTGRSRASSDVQINGATGESYRIALKRSRRKDLRTAEAAAAVAAGAAVLSEDEEMEMARIMEGAATWARANSGGSEDGDMAGSDGGRSVQGDGEGIESNVLTTSEIQDGGEESQLFYDKYTKVYVPMDGVMVKKSYGFWTWQFFGAIFFQHWIRRMYRKGFNIKKVAMGEISWDHVVTEPDHLLELKAYRCERCGYTLYPARGRHERFFDEVEDFRCPECDAPRSAFYDANDPDDPHNQDPAEPAVASASAIAAQGADSPVVDFVEGEEPSVVVEDRVSDPSSLVSLPAEVAEESSFGTNSSVSTSTTSPVSSAADDVATDDDGGDDLLDF